MLDTSRGCNEVGGTELPTGIVVMSGNETNRPARRHFDTHRDTDGRGGGGPAGGDGLRPAK